MRKSSRTMNMMIAVLIAVMVICGAGTALPSYAAGGQVNITLGSIDKLGSDAEFEFVLYKVGHYEAANLVLDEGLPGGNQVIITEADKEDAEALMRSAAALATSIKDIKDELPSYTSTPATARAGDTISFSVPANGLYLLIGSTERSGRYNWTPQPIYVDVLNGERNITISNEALVKMEKTPAVDEHTVHKTWQDIADVHERFLLSEVKVDIMYGDEVIDTVTLSDENEWMYKWSSSEKDVEGAEEGTVEVTYTGTNGVEKVFEATAGAWDCKENFEGVDPRIVARYRVTSIISKLTEDKEIIDITNSYDVTELVITKELDGIVDTGTGSNETFAFEITGTDNNGEVIYTNYAGLTFKDGDAVIKETTVGDIPKTVTSITVREVYSGSYESPATAEGGVEAVLGEDGVWTIKIDNTHSTPKDGSGVVNKYNDGNIDSREGLSTEN